MVLSEMGKKRVTIPDTNVRNDFGGVARMQQRGGLQWDGGGAERD